MVQDTREGMLAWLALALQSNAERGKMQMDPRKAANHSFFVSLNAVLLKLCEPFLEPLSGKAWGKVDPRLAAHLPAQLGLLDHLAFQCPKPPSTAALAMCWVSHEKVYYP